MTPERETVTNVSRKNLASSTFSERFGWLRTKTYHAMLRRVARRKTERQNKRKGRK